VEDVSHAFSKMGCTWLSTLPMILGLPPPPQIKVEGCVFYVLLEILIRDYCLRHLFVSLCDAVHGPLGKHMKRTPAYHAIIPVFLVILRDNGKITANVRVAYGPIGIAILWRNVKIEVTVCDFIHSFIRIVDYGCIEFIKIFMRAHGAFQILCISDELIQGYGQSCQLMKLSLNIKFNLIGM
jgi:hypothetical protein